MSGDCNENWDGKGENVGKSPGHKSAVEVREGEREGEGEGGGDEEEKEDKETAIETQAVAEVVRTEGRVIVGEVKDGVEYGQKDAPGVAE